LLIVGGEDTLVISLNEEAYEQLRCEKQLQIVSGATHPIAPEMNMLERPVRR
jgi:putative phosphoribosyl transferase